MDLVSQTCCAPLQQRRVPSRSTCASVSCVQDFTLRDMDQGERERRGGRHTPTRPSFLVDTVCGWVACDHHQLFGTAMVNSSQPLGMLLFVMTIG